MYRRNDPNQLAFEDFHLPFGGKLRSDNRWVILAKQIPWPTIEKEYAFTLEHPRAETTLQELVEEIQDWEDNKKKKKRKPGKEKR